MKLLINAWNSADSGSLPSPTAAAYAGLIEHLTIGNQGRPWCRWVEACVRNGQFFVTQAIEAASRDAFVELIATLGKSFCALSPNPKQSCAPAALTALLSTHPDADSAETILMERRSELVERGLMMAILHSGSTLRSLSRDAPGHPYRADHFFITVRWAVQEDEIFVRINPDLSQKLKSWLASINHNQNQEKLGS